MWYVRESDKEGRVVMGVLMRRILCRYDRRKWIHMFLVGLGYDTCAGVSSLQCC